MTLENNYKGYAERCLLTYDAVNVNVGDVIKIGVHWTTEDSLNVVGDACENLSGDFVTIFEYR